MPMSKYNKYFSGEKGSAAKAMAAMKEEYGDEKGEQVFYATMNKHKGGSNPMEGNSLPFQFGNGGRWFGDSRSMGTMSFGKGK